MKMLFLFLFTYTISANNLAVVDIKSFGLDSILAPIVSERLIFEIQQLNMFNLVERQNLNQVLKEQKIQLSGITDSIIEIGKILNVNYIMTGSFGKLDNNSFFFSLKLINVQTAQIATNYYIIESSFKNFVIAGPKTCLSRLLKLEKTPKTLSADVKELDVFKNTQITNLNYCRPVTIQQKTFIPCVFCSGTGKISKNLGTTIHSYRCPHCQGFKYSGPETNYKLIAGKWQ